MIICPHYRKGDKMALMEEFVSSGNWLFRWRSYLPILLGMFFTMAMYFERTIYERSFLVWDIICLLVMILGEGVRIYTVGHAPDGTSGRNVKGQEASELNTTGIYSICRHPLYLGNFLMWFGVALITRLWWANMTFCLIYWLYYERIMFAEEAFLRGKFGDTYLKWAERVPSFLPKFSLFVKSSNPFNFKKVLRKEISSFYGGFVMFIVVVLIQNLLAFQRLFLSTFWVIILLSTTIIFVVLAFLKKKTRLLENK